MIVHPGDHGILVYTRRTKVLVYEYKYSKQHAAVRVHQLEYVLVDCVYASLFTFPLLNTPEYTRTMYLVLILSLIHI